MDWVILGGSLGPRLSAEMLLRPTSLGERFMGCTVPVPVFANMPVGTSTLQRRIEMWPSPHSRAAGICVLDVLGHVLSGCSPLRSGHRLGLQQACGTKHAHSLFSLSSRKVQRKSHTSLLVVMQGMCSFSPTIVWLFAGLVSSPSGNICYSVNARDEKQARTLESKCWAVSMRLNHVILWFHSKFSFLPLFHSFLPIGLG